MNSDIRPEGGILGTHVPGGYLEEALESVEKLTEASKRTYQPEAGVPAGVTQEMSLEQPKDRPVWRRVWDLEMSPGTKYRLLQKARRLEKPRAEHYKVRRKKRRARYHRYEREGKRRRDKWLTSCPEGFYQYYKQIAHRKGIRWDITLEDFVRILSTECEGEAIYKRFFNVVRLDKRLGYSVSNVRIVERFTNVTLFCGVS